MTAHPPEPWHLGGSAHVSVWLVPVRALPRNLLDDLPRPVAPVTVAGRAVVAAAFARYEPGGVLAYDELVSGLLVRRGLRPRTTITGIWVDAPASRDGARTLWAIPKSLAAFDRRAHGDELTWEARRDGAALARSRFRTTGRLPGVHRLPTITLVQRRGRETLTSRARLLARVALAQASWEIPPDGPLGHLAGRRPLLSVALEEVSLTFRSATAP